MPRLVAVYYLESQNQTHITHIDHDTAEPITALSCNNNIHSTVKVIPNQNDVMSGRGTHVFNHPGNILLMSLVKLNLSNLQDCPKMLKPKVAEKVYSSICSEAHHYTMDSPGRFLRAMFSSESDKHNKIWVELDKKHAILKIRRAMRDYELRDKKRRKLLSDHARSLKLSELDSII